MSYEYEHSVRQRKLRNDTDINHVQEIINKAEAVNAKDEKKEKTLKAVQKFIEETLEFPKVNGYKTKVPEALIESHVNSIKACANNVFEFNISILMFQCRFPSNQMMSSTHSMTLQMYFLIILMLHLLQSLNLHVMMQKDTQA